MIPAWGASCAGRFSVASEPPRQLDVEGVEVDCRRPPRGARRFGTRPGTRADRLARPGIRPAGSGARPGPRPTAPSAASPGPVAAPGLPRRASVPAGTGAAVRARTARRSVNRGEGARRRGQRHRRQSRRSSRRGRGRLVARCAGSVLESGPGTSSSRTSSDAPAAARSTVQVAHVAAGHDREQRIPHPHLLTAAVCGRIPTWLLRGRTARLPPRDPSNPRSRRLSTDGADGEDGAGGEHGRESRLTPAPPPRPAAPSRAPP